MRVTEKCDVYSYGVVLLELLTGRMPVQPLDQGGNLVAFVKQSIRSVSGDIIPIFDTRLDLGNESIRKEMAYLLKIALTCTKHLPSQRPSMREVVTMLLQGSEKHDNIDITNNIVLESMVDNMQPSMSSPNVDDQCGVNSIRGVPRHGE